MRSRLPLAGWVGGTLCLLAGCTSDWSGHRLDSQSSTASQAASARASQGTRRTNDRGVTERDMTTPPVRTGHSADTEVVTADISPGRAKIGGGQDTPRVQPAGGLFPTRRTAEKPTSSLRQANPEAAAIVDEELPDAPEEQKQGILADLQGMSPSNVRAMLRAWKQGLARRTAGVTPAGDTAPASDESATTRIRKSLSAGLGTVTAWGTAIVGGGRKAEPSVAGIPAANPGIEPVPAPRAEKDPPLAATLEASESARPPATLDPEVPATPRNVLAELIELAEEDAAKLPPPRTQRERDEFISQHVSLRMLYLVGGRHELAMQAIPAVDPVDQEFWQHLFWGLANYFDVESIPTSEERAAEAAAQLTQAVLKLQRRAQVEIRQALFCNSVDGFGVYEPCGESDFAAGRELLVYAELGNLLSLMDDDGQYRTRHTALLELSPHGAEVDPVARLDIEEVVDLCRRQRRDYHQTYLFPLDRALPAGPYVLRLTVTDETNSKQVSQTLNLRILPAEPDEREILERKPVVRDMEPDAAIPGPRDPLQMKVRGTSRSSAKPPVDESDEIIDVPTEVPDDMPGEDSGEGDEDHDAAPPLPPID